MILEYILVTEDDKGDSFRIILSLGTHDTLGITVIDNTNYVIVIKDSTGRRQGG